MRYLLFLACLAIALAGCAGQPSPQAAPTATKIAQAPSPTPTPSPTETPTPTPTAPPSPSPTPEQATATPEPATPTPEPAPEATPTPEEPIEYVIVQQIEACDSPNEGCDGYIIAGKHFKILEQQGDWLYVRVFDPGAEEAGWNWWIQASETAYYPEGEVPPPTPTPETPPTPTPETPPAVVCEAPHWPERTPDRKTGHNISFGDYSPQIYDPDTSPYAPYYNGAYWIRAWTSDWIYRRDARIMGIDRQSGVIELYVGAGLTIKRRFTQATWVVMCAHEIYRGMPMTEAYRQGGNFCDLEVGDMVSILHQTLGEAQYLDPNLIDLWGILIVQ